MAKESFNYVTMKDNIADLKGKCKWLLEKNAILRHEVSELKDEVEKIKKYLIIE